MEHERFCPSCGGTISASHRFCPHCGASLRPERVDDTFTPGERPNRSRFQFAGGLMLPGLYVPFGRQSAGARRLGWIVALVLLAIAVLPLVFSLFLGGLFFRF